jgi:hypothetical protein
VYRRKEPMRETQLEMGPTMAAIQIDLTKSEAHVNKKGVLKRPGCFFSCVFSSPTVPLSLSLLYRHVTDSLPLFSLPLVCQKAEFQLEKQRVSNQT